MNLPMSGRVVIVDDEFREALPLIRTLSQRRVAVTFFRGRLEDLPSEPFKDVRIVFLDIVLEGLEGADDKTKISTLMNVVKKIISKENGPFVLAIWTKHLELKDKLQNALKEEEFYTLTVNLEKDTFFEKKEGSDEWTFKEDKKDKLQRIIEEKIRAIDIFKVFINWENLIHDASSMTVNEISKFSEFDDHWNDKMKRIFFSFAKAQAGRLIENMEDREKITSALYTFNQIFSDIFEKNLQLLKIEDVSLVNEDINSGTKGEINSRIILDIRETEEVYPGNVYKTEKDPKHLIYDSIDQYSLIPDFARLKDMDKLNILTKKNRIKKGFKQEFDSFFNKIRKRLKEISIPVVVEVSPVCDHTQKKIKKNRYIEGFLCPAIIKVEGTQIKLKDKLKRNALFLYITPVIKYKKRQYILVLDFRYFGSSNKNDFLENKDLLFRIRKELLSDIQIKLSSHINRTGVLYLE